MGAAGWQQVDGWQQCRSHQRQHPVNPTAANTTTHCAIRLPDMARPPGLSLFFSLHRSNGPAKSRRVGIAGVGQEVKPASELEFPPFFALTLAPTITAALCP